MAKRKPKLRREVREFLDYLEETLIPDLRDMGNEATAEDFEAVCEYVRSGVLPAENNTPEAFAEYLDYMAHEMSEAGLVGTSEDYATSHNIVDDWSSGRH